MKEKLEEMAKIIAKRSKAFRNPNVAFMTTATKTAESLYNANYRKQKEGEWIGQDDGYADGELVYDVWYCSECNHCIDDGTDDAGLLPNYCPNCGAHMRGGAE